MPGTAPRRRRASVDPKAASLDLVTNNNIEPGRQGAARISTRESVVKQNARVTRRNEQALLRRQTKARDDSLDRRRESEMRVRVDHAGHQNPAAGINDLGALARQLFISRGHHCDPFPLDLDRSREVWRSGAIKNPSVFDHVRFHRWRSSRRAVETHSAMLSIVSRFS
jgi:hypothetical protein